MYYVRSSWLGMAGAIAVAVAHSSPVNAAMVYASATYDLANFTTTEPTQPLDENVTIGQGDRVRFDVTFADNKALRLTALDDTSIMGFSMYGVDLANSTLSNVELTLHDMLTNSSFANPYEQTSTRSGNSTIGLTIFDALGAGEYMEFTGFSLVFDVDSQTAYPGFTQTDKTYIRTWLQADPYYFDSEIVDVAPVPAPPAALLLLSGLGLMGFFRWRGKRQVQAAA